MLLGFGADTREVLRTYKVNLLRRERGQAVLRLVPEHPEEASFKSIEMTVDTKTQIPVEFRVAQLDGTEAVVHINPSSIVIDAPLQDNLFRPVFASDAQVVDME
jgi:outer membrane lipoprotein-sorting protein